MRNEIRPIRALIDPPPSNLVRSQKWTVEYLAI